MRLSDINGEYDKVVSLGAACQTAAQMKNHKLRDASGPMDWFVFEDIHLLVKALENGFSDLMELNNLEVIEEHEGHWKILDKKYNCFSIHEFPCDIDYRITYPRFKEQLDRRVARFYKDIKKSEKVLFIRMHGSYDDTKLLANALSTICGNNFVLLLVNHITENKIIEKDWDIANVCSVDILQRDGEWDGYIPHWDALLKGISLSKKEFINLIDDDLFTDWYNYEYKGEDIFRWSKKRSYISLLNKKGKKFFFSIYTHNPTGIKLSINFRSRVLYTEYISQEETLIGIEITENNFLLEFDCADVWIPEKIFSNGDLRELGIIISDLYIR